MRWNEVPERARRFPPTFAAGWLRAWLRDPEHRAEVLEAYRWLAPLPGFSKGWMDDRELNAFVRPRIERALETGELVLVERTPMTGWKPTIQEPDEVERKVSEPEAPAPTKTWIEFKVVGADDKPMADVRYEARLTDQSTKSGKTGQDGTVRFDEIEPGLCEFKLLDYDADAIEALDEVKPAPPPKEPPETLEIELVDEAGQPISGQRFVVELADGSKKEGTTESDGTGKIADLEPGDYAVSFPDFAA